MRTVLLIARRELAAYLRTMSGYVIIAGVLFMEGLAFNAFALYGAGKKSSDILADFFYWSSGLTMFCAILLSMRLLAEERQTRTIELLYSSPIRDEEIVLGKFLSALGFLAFFLVSTSYMPALVMAYGKVSLGHVASGYLGLFLVGSATLAIGTFGSSLTKSQVLAAIVSGVIAVSLTICWLLSRVTERPFSEIFMEASFYGHFKPFEQGLVHLKHVVYFVAVTYVGLFSATRVLEARRWR
ncbi:MAG: ABC transporter permease subunit [Myxococcales bacterium]|nr:ABC transporter permease subunit [Myxococcales bacterium]